MDVRNNISVLYEDNHLLVVEKPPNIPVQADISGDPDLLSMLKNYIKEKYSKPGNVFLGLVHRLDRPVGGVMVFARTSKAASRLSEQIRSRKMQKTYLVVTEGSFETESGTLHNYLIKNRNENRVSVVPEGTPNSYEAVLHFDVIDRFDGMTLLKINLITGRPHQIRVQLSHNGHPVIGDAKYGKTGKNGFTDNLALWSYQLSFKHPVKDEILSFTSLPPTCYPWTLFKLS
ncbi:ribosomal large subunit pseudouridine synthase C [Thermoclostridium stercorarium subsp. stercorarium DSM 8532]|uniref:RNA pseudouridylate synthase n=2 Tax=Thermoclostridium stercorarium TaxID=1510 RepID=L7VRE6_THES1|nr:RNA pseudouridine synthase [Thermoclostridium stercorarium]AGC69357.1 ribosomal large subunit pseudouridine synthase C [Thermoclostridium stercorarium subsp. stercorarium DSM 8532]AGI40317.1 pseudouridine synthase D [Thermoclostridium stercorarium subsp. stercorarium DSM 8532]ANW99614.1 RNA pseudouridine synthase [Thermoclostridium stercorarium subsp. thermolacticum DSM 2910]